MIPSRVFFVEEESLAAMAPRVVLDFVTAEPFRPFRMHMASGRTFEVGHPEMVRVGRSSVSVHMRPESEPTTAERWQVVSLMLLESIELLEESAR